MLNGVSISFSYGGGPLILDGVDLTVGQGEIVALVGASGCGKSTLLRVLAGLEVMQAGETIWTGREALAFVFQDAALMPWATVAENVALPLRVKGKVDAGAVDKALAEVGLVGLAKRYPAGLSGGQRMRVSIARALVAAPALMFLDEPFAALDEILRFQMNALLLKLRAEHDLGCLFVTHSLYEAAYLADRVLVMQEGRIIGSHSPALDRGLLAEDQRTSPAFFAATKHIASLLSGGAA
jgi:NitT/TauT family transport system ATP-binding protein